MPNLNRVLIMGGLTRDPESKETKGGTTITNFTLAINNTYTNAAGDKKEEVTYVDCDCFGKLAEIISEYCRKGHTILVTGRLKLDTWETDGQKRSKMKVIAEEMQFISKPKSEEEERPRQQARPPQRPTAKFRTPRDPDLDTANEDDIPY